jgi:flagellar biosynthetic protein FliQ
MGAAEAIEVARQGLIVLLLVAAPVMLAGLAVGLAIALFQALTSIQEMTLTFVPKILTIFITVIIFLPFMLAQLRDFMDQLVDRMISLGM